MKLIRICALILLFSVLFTVFISAGDEETAECAWYIKRNGRKQPGIDSAQSVISKYDGYYIDARYNDSSEKQVIYLTFDLGYSNKNVESILATLSAEEVPAAFFILDNIILKNRELLVDMAKHGHLICNHTKNHKNLSSASEEEIRRNITDLEKLYREKTSMELARYFRFPEGRYSEHALRCVQELGYKTIFWSFAYDDWDNQKQPSERRAMKKVLDNTHNGAVILLHPTSETNARILPYLIKEWRRMGYTFGTLDELTQK